MNCIIFFSLFAHTQSFSHSFTSIHVASTLCSQMDFLFFTEYLQRADFPHMTSNQSCMWSKRNKKFKKGKCTLASACFSLMSVSYHGFCFCGPEMHLNLPVSSEGYLYWMNAHFFIFFCHSLFFSNKLAYRYELLASLKNLKQNCKIKLQNVSSHSA